MIVGGKEVAIQVEEIPVELLEPDLNQPRRYELGLELQAKGLEHASELASKPDGIELATRFDELRGAIIENQGISMPLVVERFNGKFRLIDGDRRLGAVRNILADHETIQENPHLKEKLAKLPCIVVDGPLTKTQKLTLLSHIHLHLAQWRPAAKQKMLMDLDEATRNEQRVSAVTGTRPTYLKKDREIRELAEELKEVKGAKAWSYARELMNIKQNLRTPDVKRLTMQKIKKGVIDDAVDIRNLRKILPDSDARAEYMKPQTRIDDAMNVLKAKELSKSLADPPQDFKDRLERLVAVLKTVRLEDIVKYKGNRELKKTVDQAMTLLSTFKGYI
jgi:hypothetical protein